MQSVCWLGFGRVIPGVYGCGRITAQWRRVGWIGKRPSARQGIMLLPKSTGLAEVNVTGSPAQP
jgi:hypothetical protein